MVRGNVGSYTSAERSCSPVEGLDYLADLDAVSVPHALVHISRGSYSRMLRSGLSTAVWRNAWEQISAMHRFDLFVALTVVVRYRWMELLSE